MCLMNNNYRVIVLQKKQITEKNIKKITVASYV